MPFDRKQLVADRLHCLRVTRGFTQYYVAKAIGIPVPTLSGYEVGRNEVSLEALVRLARFYHVSTDYILGL